MNTSHVLVQTGALFNAMLPSAGEHPWLCKIKGSDGFKPFLLSEKDFAAQKGKGFTDRKFFLAEIVNFAERMYQQHAASFENKVISELHALAASSDKVKLNVLKAECDLVRKIPLTLRTMCDRSRLKRQAYKTQGLWGKVKWFFWQRFWDSSYRIKAFEGKYAAYHENLAIEKRLLKETLSSIRDFEKSRGITQSITQGLETSDHKAVKKKWWLAYHPDKLATSLSTESERLSKKVCGFIEFSNSLA